jgi:cobalt-zinc-cadmium efflux system outer membrane protein
MKLTNVLVLSTIVLASAEDRLTLAELENMALARNPSLKQADASVRAAHGRALQSGLYPNPVVGATGDEIAAGPVYRYGEFGGFVEQRIVTAGKLSKSRRAAEQEQASEEAASGVEKQRVLNEVRRLYYQALGDRKRLEVRTSLAKLAREAVSVSNELANVGQADKPDLLAARVEAQRLEISLVAAKNAQQRTWRELAAAVNNPELKPTALDGDLENPPHLDFDAALDKIFKESPEIRKAQADETGAGLMLRRAQVEKIPDLQFRGGVRYNRELLEGSGRPVGIEGFFDIGVQIPLFNRNQGAVAAAKADEERERLEVEKTRLVLRKRLAGVFQEYQDAVSAAERYRTDMIPSAREAYQLYLKSFEDMAAAYPQVLIAQRSLFEIEEEYVNQLVGAWQASVEIDGLLMSAK